MPFEGLALLALSFEGSSEAQGKPALRITPSGLPLSPKGGVHGDDLSVKDAGLKARRYEKT